MITYYNVISAIGGLMAEIVGAEVDLQLVARLNEDRIPADVAQRELQDAVHLQPRGARRQRGTEIVERRAARAGDVLPDARRRLIAAARRVHRLPAARKGGGA